MGVGVLGGHPVARLLGCVWGRLVDLRLVFEGCLEGLC